MYRIMFACVAHSRTSSAFCAMPDRPRQIGQTSPVSPVNHLCASSSAIYLRAIARQVRSLRYRTAGHVVHDMHALKVAAGDLLRKCRVCIVSMKTPAGLTWDLSTMRQGSHTQRFRLDLLNV
jgi:hypothetical protein